MSSKKLKKPSSASKGKAADQQLSRLLTLSKSAEKCLQIFHSEDAFNALTDAQQADAYACLSEATHKLHEALHRIMERKQEGLLLHAMHHVFERKGMDAFQFFKQEVEAAAATTLTEHKGTTITTQTFLIPVASVSDIPIEALVIDERLSESLLKILAEHHPQLANATAVTIDRRLVSLEVVSEMDYQDTYELTTLFEDRFSSGQLNEAGFNGVIGEMTTDVGKREEGAGIVALHFICGAIQYEGESPLASAETIKITVVDSEDQVEASVDTNWDDRIRKSLNTVYETIDPDALIYIGPPEPFYEAMKTGVNIVQSLYTQILIQNRARILKEKGLSAEAMLPYARLVYTATSNKEVQISFLDTVTGKAIDGVQISVDPTSDQVTTSMISALQCAGFKRFVIVDRPLMVERLREMESTQFAAPNADLLANYLSHGVPIVDYGDGRITPLSATGIKY